jgi:hypothetical protein
MKKRQLYLIMLIGFCALAWIWAMAGQAVAAQKKAKEHLTPVSGKDLKPSFIQAQKASSPKVTKEVQPSLSESERKTGTVPKPAMSAQVEPLPPIRKHLRPIHKKVVPKAVVQPRTDLMYYGVLEDSQRYDPRPNPHTAGVPNPQTPDLIHDHFQELDRNQDGKIDPVERAFGRLDMDRDLHNRQLK